jgi:tetratricopeptide (TPR) repeat protein
VLATVRTQQFNHTTIKQCIMNVDELYLESEADIKNNEYTEAFKKCEAILFEEPDHAPAHNSMGWIFKTQFDDYARAENHFLMAMKMAPMYPHPYFHYATLLTDLERWEDLDLHLSFCVEIATLDKCWIHSKRAAMYELLQNYTDAINNYERAILFSLSDDKIKNYREDIERCYLKQEIIKKTIVKALKPKAVKVK